MLRPNKFRPFEGVLLRAIASLLLGAGIAGVVLGITRGQWQPALAGAGVIGLALLYLFAARRGRPL
jgi:hypothetical protein